MTGQDTGWAAELTGPLRVKPGTAVRLPDGFDPGDRLGLHKGEDGARLLRQGKELLTEYQRRLAAQDTWVSWSSCRRSTRAARTARSGT